MQAVRRGKSVLLGASNEDVAAALTQRVEEQGRMPTVHACLFEAAVAGVFEAGEVAEVLAGVVEVDDLGASSTILTAAPEP